MSFALYLEATMSSRKNSNILDEKIKELECEQSRLLNIVASMKKNEDLHLQLFENMLHEVHVWEIVHDESGKIKTWRLINANPAALKSWGMLLDEVVGKTTEEIFLDSDPVELFMPIIQKIFSEGKPQKWEHFFPSTNQYLQMVTIPFGEYFISTGVDISDEKKRNKELEKEVNRAIAAEEALRESEELLSVTLSNIEDPVFITDDDGCFTFICPNVSYALGFTDHELKMMGNVSGLLGNNLFDVELLEIQSSIANLEKTVANKKGGQRTFLINIKQVAIGEGTRLYTMRDITERKHAEEELAKHREHLELLVEDRTFKLKEAQVELIKVERLATLGRLTATVSHELRNPLGTIQAALFSVENSLERNDSSQVARSLELAERSIGRCVTIIEELNSYARVKDLNISVTSVDDWLSAVFKEQSLPEEISCELDFTSGVRASFDQEKLRQVVVNLIANAVHALQDKQSKGKHLRVSTHPLDDKYEMRFSDNGIGMTPDIKKKVFEPLFSTKGFGVGLGMVVVKNIVAQHHGEINIESNEGEGTTVTLRLPINFSGGRKNQTT